MLEGAQIVTAMLYSNIADILLNSHTVDLRLLL